jgi:putative nucleotidyltransferase with HDIG domain
MVLVTNTMARGRPSLDDACRRIGEISTLPHVALRVMEVAQRPDAGASELKELLEGDAALTARVLRSVNSSLYSLRQKITDLQHAILYLGVNVVRNMAMTASVSHLFRKEEQHGSYSRRGLWRHMVSVGICARLIAMRIRSPRFDDIYLAGLLHDIGIILEDQYVHGPFLRVLDSLEPERTLLESERGQLAFDHTTLGEAVAKKWKMPNGICDAIAYHHSSLIYRGQYQETIRCVEAANFVCSLRDLSSVGLHLVAFPREAVAGLGLGKTDLVVIAEDLDREIKNKEALFQL